MDIQSVHGTDAREDWLNVRDIPKCIVMVYNLFERNTPIFDAIH